jgi:hypothetical protein
MVMSAPTNNEIKKRLKSMAGRYGEYEQGDTIYGVRSFNNSPENGKWASGGKSFKQRKRAESRFYQEQSLRKPDVHDTVLFRATVAISNSRNGRDTISISDETVKVILTDIEILDRRKKGEYPTN